MRKSGKKSRKTTHRRPKRSGKPAAPRTGPRPAGKPAAPDPGNRPASLGGAPNPGLRPAAPGADGCAPEI